MAARALSVGDKTLAFDDVGNGGCVLCLPSGGELRSQFRHLTPHLVSRPHRVVAMDLRGQGESSAGWASYTVADMGRDALAVLDELGVERASVVGASISTATAIWLAANAPERVDAICFIAGYARPPSWFQARVIHRLLLAPLWGGGLYRAYYPRLYPSARPADHDTHERAVHAMLSEPGRLEALRRIFANTGEDWGSAVPTVRQPALVTIGAHDPEFRDPAGAVSSLAERLGSEAVQTRIFAKSGHNPHVDAAEEFGSDLAAFLAQNMDCAR